MLFSEQAELNDTADMNLSDGDHQPKDETGIERTAIPDLQAAAENFNAAFNTALYELESSRKLAVERSSRIDELNESITNINSALTDEINKGQILEEEFRLEKKQLQQKIQDIESARNDIHQQVSEHENTLNARAEEISQLSVQIEDLTSTLEERAVEVQQLQKEFVRERDMLTGELNEQKEQLNEANNQLNTQRQKLADSDKEIADINEQVEKLTTELNSRTVASEQQEQEHNQETTRLGTEILELNENLQSKDKLLEQHCNELESKVNEVASLNESIDKLKDEVDAQAASMQMQSESHARASEELELRISDISGELESMHAAQKELEAHSEKLENLNRALHESSISENDLHKTLLEDKDNVIGSLRTKLATAGDSPNVQADKSSLIDDLQSEIRDLESRLQHAEQAEISETVDSLRDEAEKLKSELSASEEKREQLQTALSSALEADGTTNAGQSPATQGLQPVAGSAGRSQFVSHLNALLAEESGSDKNHTVMYILLDNFIRVRDEIGIMDSEHLINEISEIITSFCDDNDTISRFGDCTFAILSCNESTKETQEKAEKIRSTVEHYIFEISGNSVITSTSIGICRIRDNDTCAEEVISRADLSCEVARSSGGNKVMVNSAVTDEIVVTGSNVNHEEMVSSALTEDRMMIYYQPISSLKDIPGNHFEILVRIVDESGNIILPGEYFAMAETTGQAVDIDLYIIEKVMRMMAENQDKEMLLFIKLNRQTVADHDFPLWVIGKIKEYSINPEQLVFEIAENTLQTNLKNLSMLSKALHTIGCKIAIEHYKMSTKPQHLLHIHTDYLKIDSSLIEDLSRKGKNFEEVSAILEIAGKNNYITIAEGVENPTALAILWELGVSLAQGYFIQAPTESHNFNFQDVVSDNNDA
jgi:diguanylate cyclase (GGDEF)-like protein